MSGPKGIGYVVESAEQREARERAAAQARWQVLAPRHAELIERARAHGRTAELPVPLGQAASAAQIEAAVTDLSRRHAELEAALDEQLREASRRAVASSIASVVSPRDLKSQSRRTSRPRAANDVAAPAAPEPDAAHRATEILGRLLQPHPELEKRAAEIVQAPPARARLLLDDLSRMVAQHNAEARESRLREEARLSVEAERVAAEASQRSDRDFVLTAVIEALGELGYDVAETTVAEPATLVLDRGEPEGYGVQLGVADGEVSLRSVRLDPDLDGTGDKAADEDLCLAIPQLTDGMARRGLRATKVRSVPAGVLAAPVVDIVTDRETRQSVRARSNRTRGA